MRKQDLLFESISRQPIHTPATYIDQHRDGATRFRTVPRSPLNRRKGTVAAATAAVVLMLGSAGVACEQKLKADREQDVAERRFADVRQIARAYMIEFDQKLLAIPARQNFVLSLLRRTLDAVDQLAPEVGNAGTQSIGNALHWIPDLLLAVRPIRRAKVMSETILRYRDFAHAGVQTIMEVGPQNGLAHRFDQDSLIETHFTALTLPNNSVIPFDSAAIFEQLRAEHKKRRARKLICRRALSKRAHAKHDGRN